MSIIHISYTILSDVSLECAMQTLAFDCKNQWIPKLNRSKYNV